MVEKTSKGIGTLSLLTIVFIILKLTDYIDWSWFWVLSPTLIPIIVGILLTSLIFIIAMINSR